MFSSVPCSYVDFCLSPFRITPNDCVCCACELAVSRKIITKRIITYGKHPNMNAYVYGSHWNAHALIIERLHSNTHWNGIRNDNLGM